MASSRAFARSNRLLTSSRHRVNIPKKKDSERKSDLGDEQDADFEAAGLPLVVALTNECQRISVRCDMPRTAAWQLTLLHIQQDAPVRGNKKEGIKSQKERELTRRVASRSAKSS